MSHNLVLLFELSLKENLDDSSVLLFLNLDFWEKISILQLIFHSFVLKIGQEGSAAQTDITSVFVNNELIQAIE